ncbi:MAG TPA: hypothetical protein VIJ40_01730 [Acidimicrobiales bacterium]
MSSNDRFVARALVVAGYSVVTVGYLVQCIDYSSKDGFHNSFGIELFLYYVSIPLAYGITGWSWYWLTHMTPSTSEDPKFRRRGLRGLALQSLVMSIGTFAITNAFRTLPDESVTVLGWLLVGIGGLVVSVGFWFFTSEFGSRGRGATPLADRVP